MKFTRLVALALCLGLCGALAPTTLAADPAPAAESRETKPGQRPVVGDVFPDIVGKTYDGKELKLSDHRGKVVLVDFWATWCGPCMREMPNIKKAYKAYHDKGFEVFAVSLDTDEDALRAYYEGDNASPWPTVYDGEGWKSPYVSQFAITGIPALFLLNQNGEVVSTSARGTALWADLVKLLDPEGTPPPDLGNLADAYFKADAEGRTALIAAAHQYAPNFPDEVNGGAYAYLESADNPDPEFTAHLVDLMKAITADGDPSPWALDTLALAQYHAGDAGAALKTMEQTVKLVDDMIQRRQPDLEGDIVERMGKVGLGELAARMIVFQAASGDSAAARANITKLDEKTRAGKWGKMASGKLAESLMGAQRLPVDTGMTAQ
jgi:thiol-disulfide isomerase/thioredoxin